jgi:hypothetical protein
MIARIRYAAIVVAMAFTSCGTIWQSAHQVIAAEPAKNAADDPRHLAPWSGADGGLQGSVLVGETIEQGMPLAVEWKMRCEPEALAKGVRQLNTFLIGLHLELVLKNVESGELISIRPIDPTYGLPVLDEGKGVVPLGGMSIPDSSISFPLASGYERIVPGEYEGQVKLSIPSEPTVGWRGTRESWNAQGFWSGTIVTGTFRLRVTPQQPKSRTISVPTQLKFGPANDVGARAVSFGEPQEIEVSLRNGHVIGTYFFSNGRMSTLSGGPPRLEDGDLDVLGPGDGPTSYTFEVFETADHARHFWQPHAGSGGYRVLWRHTFVAFPASTWTVTFANHMVETCTVQEDGTVTVSEPQRTSTGKFEIRDGDFVIAYADDRMERWTRAGTAIIVEHWFPSAGFGTTRPVLGIAEHAK